jgi:hypothetical protein
VHLDPDGAAARGLRRYVRLVAEAIGVGAEASTIQLDEPVSVYLALDRCSPRHPDQDLALLWDERRGWALGVESVASADVLVLGFLADELLPSPSTVADYVAAACRDEGFGAALPDETLRDETPPDETLPDAKSLAGRLADYANQVHDLRFSWSVSPGSRSPSGK